MMEVDRNNDGNINFDEFESVMNNLLHKKYHGLSSMIGVFRLKFIKSMGL